MNIQELVQAIYRGDYDNDRDTLQEALNARRRIAQASDASTVRSIVKSGDVCTLRNIRPKYLTGVKVRVLNTMTGTKYIECEYAENVYKGKHPRYAGSKTQIPPSCLLPSKDVLDRAAGN